MRPAMPIVDCDTGPVVAWLVDGARSAPQAQQVMGEMCERLVQCGLPLWRVAVFVRTLHPQIMGRRFLWRPGVEVVVSEAPYEFLDTAAFLENPFAHVAATGGAVRRRLADPDCPLDFPYLQELLAEDATDYFAAPLHFTDGSVHLATWATRQPGGFSDAQLRGLEAVIAPLARVAEIRAMRRTAGVLLDTYVGHHAGERILAGQIRRGDVEEIDAAIWLSDMRGFTALADRLPPQLLLDLLNRYFDCQVPAILEHGGEVLKFMGDGLLAIFRTAADAAVAETVCGRALAAARLARSHIAALAPTVDLDLRFGLALHLGTVSFGNIGGGDRLDFTCIGPAVNLAARIEKLAGPLGRTILASQEFARHCGREFAAIGDFALPGFAEAQQVFGIDEEFS
jgi:adenylate cyclase